MDIHSSIGDDVVIIAADSTGIKVTSRGQWMQEKWNIKSKKGYLKIHVYQLAYVIEPPLTNSSSY